MENITDYKWKEAYDTAVDLARRGGKEIMKAWDDTKKLKVKSCSIDLVTQTDKEVEKMISMTIKEKFPSHSFIGEESVAAGEPCILTDNPTWIVDPVDGTTNFVHGFPFVAVSIAFADKKKLEFGVVYICNHDWMYTGITGKGAYCNGESVQVSCVTDVKKSLIISERGYHRCPEIVEKVSNTMKKILCIPVHGLRGTGTAATNMCLVASGAVEAFFEIGIHCWDIAAGAVIVREAGGVLLDVNGKDFDLMSRRMVSANSKAIADRIIKEIEIFDVERDDAPQGQQQQQQQQ